ncbi:ATP-dependent Clp protease proteolytic subunit [Sphingomonas sabuli]|uniref:ATP-dependent Clp protease proteolytic subunit n=1 Tax=Sphingomonas sabuli TaxID=2764186 RepID=A0A7G9L0Q8_9SPHN|nr:ATP-dependent Clp protease proteolytic subunit [Sphingomonas sabuli]QNM82207.1 ATP-dependent Clp protease proteolytic subunit [Sphingomonas sabuli]
MQDDMPEDSQVNPSDFAGKIEAELLRTRKVLIFGEVHDRLARDICARLLLLADRDSSAPIDIYINSPGGHVESGDTIHDMVRFVRNDVQINMIGTGWVASAGAHIYLAAEKARRFCLPNTRFMLHQPAGGVRGMAADIEIEAKEILRMRERLVKVIAEETGQPVERINKDIHRNHWMSTEEAIDYGMVAQVIRDPKDIPAK